MPPPPPSPKPDPKKSTTSSTTTTIVATSVVTTTATTTPDPIIITATPTTTTTTTTVFTLAGGDMGATSAPSSSPTPIIIISTVTPTNFPSPSTSIDTGTSIQTVPTGSPIMPSTSLIIAGNGGANGQGTGTETNNTSMTAIFVSVSLLLFVFVIGAFATLVAIRHRRRRASSIGDGSTNMITLQTPLASKELIAAVTKTPADFPTFPGTGKKLMDDLPLDSPAESPPHSASPPLPPLKIQQPQPMTHTHNDGRLSDREFGQLRKQATALAKEGRTASVVRRQEDGKLVWKPLHVRTGSIISSLMGTLGKPWQPMNDFKPVQYDLEVGSISDGGSGGSGSKSDRSSVNPQGWETMPLAAPLEPSGGGDAQVGQVSGSKSSDPIMHIAWRDSLSRTGEEVSIQGPASEKTTPAQSSTSTLPFPS